MVEYLGIFLGSVHPEFVITVCPLILTVVQCGNSPGVLITQCCNSVKSVQQAYFAVLKSC